MRLKRLQGIAPWVPSALGAPPPVWLAPAYDLHGLKALAEQWGPAVRLDFALVLGAGGLSVARWQSERHREEFAVEVTMLSQVLSHEANALAGLREVVAEQALVRVWVEASHAKLIYADQGLEHALRQRNGALYAELAPRLHAGANEAKVNDD